ncbi:GbNV_gp28-like-1 [Fopius arisanus]|nr:GbNV_gp28-like-1 [Fopius arisanus]
MNAIQRSALYGEQCFLMHLIIKKKPAKVSELQKKNSALYTSFKGDTSITDVDVKDYAITNMPPLFETLPRNTVFDFIRNLTDDCPDYRLTSVDNELETQNHIPHPIPVVSQYPVSFPKTPTKPHTRQIFTELVTRPDSPDEASVSHEYDDEDSDV